MTLGRTSPRNVIRGLRVHRLPLLAEPSFAVCATIVYCWARL